MHVFKMASSKFRPARRLAVAPAAVLLLICPAFHRLWDEMSQLSAAEPLPPNQNTVEPMIPKGGPNVNLAHIEGESQCVDCHRAEFAHLWGQWRESEHGWIGYSRLLGSRAEELAKDLGIETNRLTKDSVCIECHATPNLDFHGRNRPILGVTCEACHNPSGGEDGWLNVHAAYGPPGTRRVDETPEHFHDRKREAQRRGQLQSANVYALVRRCYDCHIVGDEKLITETDHQVEDRDFSDIVEHLADEKIRHNFHLDQSENAPVASLWTDAHWYPQRTANLARTIENRKKMYYVVSVLARADTILRLLAKASDPLGDYAGDVASLLDVRDLEDALESVDMSDAERENVEDMIESLEDMELEDTAGDQDEDESLSDDEVQALVSMADRIAELGRSIAGGDGDDLAEVELP